MKKIITILILSILELSSNAQTKLSDVNRIVLNTYIPDQAEPIPDQAKSLLENKLSQIASNNGKWYFVSNEAFAKKKIYFVNNEAFADLKIYFVNNEAFAGWKNRSKMYLMQ